jgi:hypothetical protein
MARKLIRRRRLRVATSPRAGASVSGSTRPTAVRRRPRKAPSKPPFVACGWFSHTLQKRLIFLKYKSPAVAKWEPELCSQSSNRRLLD